MNRFVSIVVLLSLVWPLAALQAQQQKPVLALHRVAPDFTLQTATATSFTLSSLRGKVVLVDFWASWCMPCRAAIPHLKEVYAQYHAKGFEILSVSADASENAWKKALEKEQMPWHQVIDHYTEGKAYSDVWLRYGIKSVPFVVLLDKTGKIIAINPAADTIGQEVKMLLGE